MVFECLCICQHLVLVAVVALLRCVFSPGHSAVRSVLKGGAPELPDKFYPYFSHI